MKIALLTAAGKSTRMKMETPKQFLNIAGKPIIVHTMEAFQKHPEIDTIIVVTQNKWIDTINAYAKQFEITKLKWIAIGGDTGQESIYNGLQVLAEHCSLDDTVIIHDGNRPFVSQEVITDSLSTYREYGCAVAAIPCIEAIFQSDDGISSERQYPREELYRTQTPHTYSLNKLLWAHSEASKRKITNTTATCTLMQLLGEKIYFSRGSEKNLKMTTQDDIDIFKAMVNLSE